MKMRRLIRMTALLVIAQMLLAGGIWWVAQRRPASSSDPAGALPVAQQRLAQLYALAAFRAVIASDHAALNGLIRPSEAWPEVAYVSVEDAQGKILASSDPSKVGRTWNAGLASEMQTTVKGAFEETSAAVVDAGQGKNGARVGLVRVAYLAAPPAGPPAERPEGVSLLAVLAVAALAAIPLAILAEIVAGTAPGMTAKEYRLLDQLRETRMEAQRFREDAAVVQSERDQQGREIEELRKSITHYRGELQKLRADAVLVEAHLSGGQSGDSASEAGPDGAPLRSPAGPPRDPHAEATLRHELKELHVRTVTQLAQAFRSSLTNILGYSKLLLRAGDGDLSPMQRTNVANILDSGTRLVSLVNGLSDYVRVDAGMNAPAAAAVDLGAMVARVLAEAQRQGGQLETTTLPEPLLVHADPRHVEQIVRALVTDAVAVDPQARGGLSATSQEGRVVLELVLTTAHVTPEDLRPLLDPFRGDDPSRPLDESRLRLALARGFAEANGGQLRLRTEHPNEVAFVLDLPAAPAAVTS